MATTDPDFHIILFGDSDFDQWPSFLLPKGEENCSVFGYSGALLSQVVDHLDEAKALCDKLKASNVVWLISAGENDACQKLPLNGTEAALTRLLDGISDISKHHRVVILGPKFEPWLYEDQESRKLYANMARAFERQCSSRDNCHFVDCLTMFCDGADQPGALVKAKPIPAFFASDQLHLGEEGYRKWKVIVEETFQKLGISN